MYKLSEFARLMGVSRSDVIKWIREGRVRAVNIHGRWYIRESEYERLTKGYYTGVKRVAIYARVSGNAQKDDLERQISSLEDYVKNTIHKQNTWLSRTLLVVLRKIGGG